VCLGALNGFVRSQDQNRLPLAPPTRWSGKMRALLFLDLSATWVIPSSAEDVRGILSRTVESSRSVWSSQ
jgi:hypothetical protein